uniref:Tankyrase 1-binding protein C-terminal domain-containing protein n=1 Tax=Pyxicephalus adspersus TaxID=30357 RepID=A0AAV2ZFU2_PYXAD|nr:TPA: hypothetical protein GDO54_004696 [Pyxicephalus adspersus]
MESQTLEDDSLIPGEVIPHPVNDSKEPSHSYVERHTQPDNPQKDLSPLEGCKSSRQELNFEEIQFRYSENSSQDPAAGVTQPDELSDHYKQSTRLEYYTSHSPREYEHEVLLDKLDDRIDELKKIQYSQSQKQECSYLQTVGLDDKQSNEPVHTHGELVEPEYKYQQPVHTYIQSIKPNEQLEESVQRYDQSKEPVNAYEDLQDMPVSRYLKSEGSDFKLEHTEEFDHRHQKLAHLVPKYEPLEEPSFRCEESEETVHRDDQSEESVHKYKQSDMLAGRFAQSEQLVQSCQQPGKIFHTYQVSEVPVHRYEPSEESAQKNEHSEDPINKYKQSEESEDPIDKNKQSEESEDPTNKYRQSEESEDPIDKYTQSEESEDPIDKYKQSEELEDPTNKYRQSEESEDPIDKYKQSEESEDPTNKYKQSKESEDLFNKYRQSEQSENAYLESVHKNELFEDPAQKYNQYELTAKFEHTEQPVQEYQNSAKLIPKYEMSEEPVNKDKQSEEIIDSYDQSQEPDHKYQLHDEPVYISDPVNQYGQIKDPSYSHMGSDAKSLESSHDIVRCSEEDVRANEYLDQQPNDICTEDIKYSDTLADKVHDREKTLEDQVHKKQLSEQQQEDIPHGYTKSEEDEHVDGTLEGSKQELLTITNVESDETMTDGLQDQDATMTCQIPIGHAEHGELQTVDHILHAIKESQAEEPKETQEEEPRVENFDFLEGTGVLDSSLMKGRASLGRKRCHRTPAGTPAEEEKDSQYWMFRDSTEPKNAVELQSDEEEKDETPPDETPENSPSPVKSPNKKGIFAGIISPSLLKGRLKTRSKTIEDEPVKPQTEESKSPVKEKPESPGHSLNWLHALKKKKKTTKESFKEEKKKPK